MSEIYRSLRWAHNLQQLVTRVKKFQIIENTLHLQTLSSQFVKTFNIKNSRVMIAIIGKKTCALFSIIELSMFIEWSLKII